MNCFTDPVNNDFIPWTVRVLSSNKWRQKQKLVRVILSHHNYAETRTKYFPNKIFYLLLSLLTGTIFIVCNCVIINLCNYRDSHKLAAWQQVKHYRKDVRTGLYNRFCINLQVTHVDFPGSVSIQPKLQRDTM